MQCTRPRVIRAACGVNIYSYLFLALVFCDRPLYGMSCLTGYRPPDCEIPLNLAFHKLLGMIIREALKAAVKRLYRATQAYRKLRFKSNRF